MPRAVSDTVETGGQESPSRHNALRTPAPRPTAASMSKHYRQGKAAHPNESESDICQAVVGSRYQVPGFVSVPGFSISARL